MRRYENILIVAPDCTKEEEEDLLRRVQGNVEKLGRSCSRSMTGACGSWRTP